MPKKIEVFNYGFVEYVGHMGNDLSVVNAARVSFNKSKSELDDKDVRLLQYLASHGHWSPFAHATISLRIKAPVSVQRQYEKHHVGVNNNSESTRYVAVKSEFYIPERLRVQATDKKQGSGGFMKDEIHEHELLEELALTYARQFWLYEELLKSGVANELARDVLPLATYTTWISTMSLYAAFNIWKLRTHDGAQEEIGEYAKAIEQMVEPLFPHSWRALQGAL